MLLRGNRAAWTSIQVQSRRRDAKRAEIRRADQRSRGARRTQPRRSDVSTLRATSVAALVGLWRWRFRLRDVRLRYFGKKSGERVGANAAPTRRLSRARRARGAHASDRFVQAGVRDAALDGVDAAVVGLGGRLWLCGLLAGALETSPERCSILPPATRRHRPRSPLRVGRPRSADCRCTIIGCATFATSRLLGAGSRDPAGANERAAPTARAH